MPRCGPPPLALAGTAAGRWPSARCGRCLALALGRGGRGGALPVARWAWPAGAAAPAASVRLLLGLRRRALGLSSVRASAAGAFASAAAALAAGALAAVGGAAAAEQRAQASASSTVDAAAFTSTGRLQRRDQVLARDAPSPWLSRRRASSPLTPGLLSDWLLGLGGGSSAAPVSAVRSVAPSSATGSSATSARHLGCLGDRRSLSRRARSAAGSSAAGSSAAAPRAAGSSAAGSSGSGSSAVGWPLLVGQRLVRGQAAVARARQRRVRAPLAGAQHGVAAPGDVLLRLAARARPRPPRTRSRT